MSLAARRYGSARERRDALVLTHLPMVKRVALHLRARVPPLMEVDEMVQVGLIGLLEAARAWEPSNGTPFDAFALQRVRGAILDELRRISPLPRSSMSFNREHGQAVRGLVHELGRQPSEREVADAMGVELQTLQKDRTTAHRFDVCSIEENEEEVMAIAADPRGRPDQQAERRQLVEALVSHLEQLPEREHLVVSLYYVEELNLREIGAVLEVSESRVSQILSGAVKQLRAAMGA